MNTELYRALLDAGAPEESASKAAESVAAFDRHFERLDGRMNTLVWMVATNVTLTLLLCGGVIWKLMDVSEKLGGLMESVGRLSS